MSVTHDKRIRELQSKSIRSRLENRELQLLLKFNRIWKAPRKKWSDPSRNLWDTFLDWWDDKRLEPVNKALDEIVYRKFFTDLTHAGFKFRNFKQLEISVKELKGDTIQAIVDLIPVSSSYIQGELVHLVARTKRVYNAKPLADLYDSLPVGDGIRWIIGNCVSQSQAREIDDWVRKKLRNPDDKRNWERLAEYAGKRLPAREAIDLLKPLISLSPPNVAYGLSFCGGEAEIEFLQAFHDSISPHGNSELRLNIRRPINRIRKRLDRRARKTSNN